MDANVIILIKNLVTLAPVHSNLDYQATVAVVNALLLRLSQRPLLHTNPPSVVHPVSREPCVLPRGILVL
jgi:hypothetical protein